jgi:hypothetical protein
MNLKKLSIFAFVLLAGIVSVCQTAQAQVSLMIPYNFYHNIENAGQMWQQIPIDRANCGLACQADKAELLALLANINVTVVSDSVIIDSGSTVWSILDQETFTWDYEVEWRLQGFLIVSGTQAQIDTLSFLLGLFE